MQPGIKSPERKRCSDYYREQNRLRPDQRKNRGDSDAPQQERRGFRNLADGLLTVKIGLSGR